jgi:hypothetical protein
MFLCPEFDAAIQEVLDGGISKPMSGLLVLSRERFGEITQRLSDLRCEVGAQCILLSDQTGQVLIRVGGMDNLQPGQLVTLMRRGWAGVTELAQHLCEDHSFNLHYHAGTRYDLYMVSLSEQLFVTSIFDRRQGVSRVGMVWLYTKRAIQDLLHMITPTC